jgi:HlyD family secretion protein
VSDQLSSDLASLRIAREDAPPSRLGRTLVVLALVAGLLGAGWVWGYPYVQARIFKPEVDVTQIALVSPAEADVQLTSTGYVVAQRISRVGAKITGTLAKIHVEQGDVVEAGQVIAELEAADMEAALKTARSRVALAKAQAATAKAELADALRKAKRERGLASQGVAAAETADDLEARAGAADTQLKAANAAVKAAQAEVEALSVNLDYLEVTAPISGTVVSKPATQGELVGQMAATIAELADFSSLVVETDVPEARLHLVHEGGPCEIMLDAFPGKRYRGRIREITPRVDRAKATITVKVEFLDATDRVLPDMAARVNVLAKELEAGAVDEPAKVVVPAVAIAERNGAKVVFVLEDELVRMYPITLGEPVGSGFELVEGPPAGTTLVREPSAELADGQKVSRKDAK